MFPIVMLVLNVSSVAVLWFGAQRVDDGDIEIGALIAFLTYLIQILLSVMMATFMMMMLPRAIVSADRISEVLDTESSVVPPANPVVRLPQASVVRAGGVEFSYPGAERRCCADISFTARAGQTTAIIGSTGAGKTTLLSLIPRLFDATGGIGPGRRRGRPRLRPRAALEPDRSGAAEAVPVHRHGRRPTCATATRTPPTTSSGTPCASPRPRTSCARWTGELDSAIAQGGSNVSGGQRQRLAIARALVEQPEIYLFDDSFSALDLATDARLRAALKAETTGA